MIFSICISVNVNIVVYIGGVRLLMGNYLKSKVGHLSVRHYIATYSRTHWILPSIFIKIYIKIKVLRVLYRLYFTMWFNMSCFG